MSRKKLRLSSRSKEYNTIHQWNLRHWVKTGVCEKCCLARKTQWSNISGQYLKGIRHDWQELCQSCHNLYDYSTFGIPKNIGRPKKSGKQKTLLTF